MIQQYNDDDDEEEQEERDEKSYRERRNKYRLWYTATCLPGVKRRVSADKVRTMVDSSTRE